MRRVADLVGGPVLRPVDFTKHSGISANVLARRFGRWRDVLERAGLGHMCPSGVEGLKRLSRRKYSDEQLVEELQRVAKVLGQPHLSSSTFTIHSDISVSTVVTRFGSWLAALERAGLGCPPQREHRKYSDDCILDQIRRVVGIANRPVLYARDFKEHTGISAAYVCKRFGGWQAALERAGVGHMCGFRTHSREEILDLIREVSQEAGRDDLDAAVFQSRTGIGYATVSRFFESWRHAREEAGFSFNKHRREYSKEECLRNIGRLWAHYGRPPVLVETQDPPSLVLRRAYLHLWDQKWSEMMKAFYVWAESLEAVAHVNDPNSPEVDLSLAFDVIRRGGFRCAVCNKRPTCRNGVNLHVAHTIPPGDGGQTTADSLRALCVAVIRRMPQPEQGLPAIETLCRTRRCWRNSGV